MPKRPAQTISASMSAWLQQEHGQTLSEASDAWLEARATRSAERMARRRFGQGRVTSTDQGTSRVQFAAETETREAVGRVNWAANMTAPDTSQMPNLPSDSEDEDAPMSEEEYPQGWEETSSTLL